MRQLVMVLLCTSLAGMIAASASRQAVAAEKAGPALAHDVYFTLKDKSPAAKKKLVDACKKYLTNHPGEVSFDVGTRAENLSRDVNDKDFDVALHIVFQSKAAHDTYSEAERHKQFIAECRDNWDKVRVFDSYSSK